MGLDGPHRDVEPGRDLLVAGAAADQVSDLALARAQAAEVAVWILAGVWGLGFGEGGELVEKIGE